MATHVPHLGFQEQNVLGEIKQSIAWAVVVAQLAERSPPTPEIRRSNPVIVIGKTLFDCQLYFNSEKTKINEKEAGNSPFFEKSMEYGAYGHTYNKVFLKISCTDL